MAAAVDRDEDDAAIVGACGGRRGHRTVGGGSGSAALIDVAPERIDVGHRGAVDDAEALPTAIGDEPIPVVP